MVMNGGLMGSDRRRSRGNNGSLIASKDGDSVLQKMLLLAVLVVLKVVE